MHLLFACVPTIDLATSYWQLIRCFSAYIPFVVLLGRPHGPRIRHAVDDCAQRSPRLSILLASTQLTAIPQGMHKVWNSHDSPGHIEVRILLPSLGMC